MKLIAYRICRRLGLFRLTRYLTRNRLNILCYHGFEIANEAEFRPKLFMNSEVFSRRMQAINEGNFHVLPLSEALQELGNGSLLPHSVVLTIDDGFFSVLENAAPILRSFEYASTLYVTSYYADKEVPIYGLLIQYLFWRTNLSRLHGFEYEDLRIGNSDLSEPETRHRVMWSIIEYGNRCGSESGRQTLAARLAESLQVDDLNEITGSRMLSLLTADELVQLETFGIDVQLHTHRHTISTTDMAVARREIADNRRWLESVLGHTLDHFCYPSGVWCQEQWQILDDLGIASATTCDPGMNTPRTPRYGLLRFLDQNDLSLVEFEAELYGFKEVLRNLRLRAMRVMSALGR